MKKSKKLKLVRNIIYMILIIGVLIYINPYDMYYNSHINYRYNEIVLSFFAFIVPSFALNGFFFQNLIDKNLSNN